jgi:hypothetical protein
MSQFVPTQIDANVALQALATRQQAFDNTLQYLSEFDPRVDFMNYDQQTGQKIRDDYMNQLNTAADDLINNDNIQGALKNFYQIRGKYKRDASSGDIWALSQRKAQHDSYLKTIEEFSKTNPEEARIAYNTYLSKVQPYGNQLRNERGDYVTNFESPYLFKTPDISEKINRIADNIKADGSPIQFDGGVVQFDKSNNQWLMTQDGKQTYVSKDKAYAAIAQTIYGDPEIQDYYKAMSYHGLGEQAAQNIESMISGGVTAATFYDTDLKTSIHRDPNDEGSNGNGSNPPFKGGYVQTPEAGQPLNLLDKYVNYNQAIEESRKILESETSSEQQKVEAKNNIAILEKAEGAFITNADGKSAKGAELATKLFDYETSLADEEKEVLNYVEKVNDDLKIATKELNNSQGADVENIYPFPGGIFNPDNWIVNTQIENAAQKGAKNSALSKITQITKSDAYVHATIMKSSELPLEIESTDEIPTEVITRDVNGVKASHPMTKASIIYNEKTGDYEYYPSSNSKVNAIKNKKIIEKDQYEKLKEGNALFNSQGYKEYENNKKEYDNEFTNYLKSFETKATGYVPVNMSSGQMTSFTENLKRVINAGEFNVTVHRQVGENGKEELTRTGSNDKNKEVLRNVLTNNLNVKGNMVVDNVKLDNATNEVFLKLEFETKEGDDTKMNWVDLKLPINFDPNGATVFILSHLGEAGEQVLEEMYRGATGDTGASGTDLYNSGLSFKTEKIRGQNGVRPVNVLTNQDGTQYTSENLRMDLQEIAASDPELASKLVGQIENNDFLRGLYEKYLQTGTLIPLAAENETEKRIISGLVYNIQELKNQISNTQQTK